MELLGKSKTYTIGIWYAFIIQFFHGYYGRRRLWKTMGTAICMTISGFCIFYGIMIRAIGSGTLFFLVWFALAAGSAGLGLLIHRGIWAALPGGIRILCYAILGAGVLFFLVFLAFLSTGWWAAGAENLDYIIVLGAQISENGPSAVLQYRLDRAADYLEQNPDTVCIVSGAQGRNEPCTEAEGMADYLLTKGIPAERILQEREAHTTAENLAYSRKLMPEGSSVGIVTNNFHVFRALQIAREQGLEDAVGIAAGAKPFYQLNNILREYLAEIKYLISRIVS